ncbi:TonB-dependent receptor [Erythrobacter sp. YT30]|uniref:TonB-dependent receptor n=1 Tax=Erythrobacter sp. YT30 TaxID=1735012 RepID=UPI00076C8C35|nr:TonB-dependent receptor [Erythrobacter sp. YT30]KWV91642.1 TonB-dependent receptor [Erythrobacter sp. YT30]
MKTLTSRLALTTALTFVIGTAPALAQSTSQTSEADGSQNDSAAGDDDEGDPHYRGGKDIIVSAEGLEQLDFLAGKAVVNAADIQRNLNGQIGEVLAKLPGVSASSFAPGASRPILRGFDGERVRVLIDGLGTADVSNTSADHAVSIDPLTAQRIEVLRGPASLLYGSQAIGGVVNVIDKRIPYAVPDEDFHLDALVAADTATDLLTAGASLDVPVGENFVVHVDGSWRDTGNVEIPGFQLSDELRADILAGADEEEAEGEFEEAEELRETANQRGFLPNSGTETWTVNGGFTAFLGEHSIGASVGYYDTFYGLIGRPGAEHAHGEEGEGEEEEEEGEEIVSIGLEQWRADMRAQIALGDGFFSKLNVRAGYSDYTHTEFEGEEVGTVFDTESFEARAELIQSSGGVIGAQYTARDFSAIGEEAFVPPNFTRQIALFTAQEFDLNGIQIEAAGRYENVDVESDVLGLERNFDLFSGALSAILVTDGGTRFGLTGSRAERAPAGEELFANGPHIATQAFEFGDPDLDVESAWGLEAFVNAGFGKTQLNVAVFYQSFDDFIFLSPTGEEEDDLPVFVFLQEDATFFGFEADLLVPIVDNGEFTLDADLRAEYVSADLNGDPATGGIDGNVPRIPPVSLLGALDAGIGAFDVRGEVEWFASQNDVAEFEAETDSFTLVNLAVAWRPIPSNQSVTLMLNADNLFDVTGRRHSSFTKDFVTLPGRNFRASVRVSF